MARPAVWVGIVPVGKPFRWQVRNEKPAVREKVRDLRKVRGGGKNAGWPQAFARIKASKIIILLALWSTSFSVVDHG